DGDGAREVAADERLERGARLDEVSRQLALESPLRIRHRREHAAAAEQAALGARLGDDVGDQAREQNVVGADGEQHQVEIALGTLASGRRQQVGELGDLGAYRSGAGRAGARARAFARPLAPEESGIDGGARAAQREERHRDVWVLGRERERGAHLIAVERAVAGTAEPARALARPLARPGVLAGNGVAGLVAVEAGAAGTIIFEAVEALEA